MDWFLETFNFTEKNFTAFGLEHALVVGLFFIIGIGLIRLAKKRGDKATRRIALGISVVLIFNILFDQVLDIALGEFDIKKTLPLNLCNICPFFIPLVLVQKRYWWHEILYFFILTGTLQAVLTPDLNYILPHREAIQYWITHCGLVVGILFATIVYDFIPTWKSLPKAFIALQVYVVAMACINLITGGNYFFLCQTPPNPSLLDFLGEWPMYIFLGEFLALALMFIVFLPILYFYPQSRKWK